jgi:CRISPR-associated protein Cmr4
MFKESLVLGFFSETPLHPGTGTTTGVIDLPIQRESHTEFPLIQSAGLKGAMRELGEDTWGIGDKVNVIFGPEKAENAGSIAVTDARLIAFPVRSLSHVHVWVTCPQVLSRYVRDMALLGKIVSHAIPTPASNKYITSTVSDLSGKLVLEELVFDRDSTKAPDVDGWLTEIIKLLSDKKQYKNTIEKMKKHLVIIPDNDFKYFVTSCTQVSARIKLKDNKTNENLWYEEILPPDCLFYSMLMVMKPRKEKNTTLPPDLDDAPKIKKKLQELLTDYIQIGGNETTGMGWCAVKLLNGGSRP